MSNKSYFTQYESPNIVIVPNTTFKDPPAKRPRVENNITVPIVDNVDYVKNNIQEQGCGVQKCTTQASSSAEMKEVDKKSIVNSSTNKKVSWATNYLQSIGMTQKSSIWQHKIPRIVTSQKHTVTDNRSRVLLTNIKNAKCEQSNKPNQTEVNTNNLNYKSTYDSTNCTQNQDTKVKLKKEKSSPIENSELKDDCVNLSTKKNSKKNEAMNSVNYKNIVSTPKKINIGNNKNYLQSLSKCNNRQPIVEKRDLTKKPKTETNKVITKDKFSEKSTFKCDKIYKTKRDLIPNVKSVIINPSRKNKKESDSDKIRQKIKNEVSLPSSSYVSKNLKDNLTKRRNALGEVTSIKKNLKVTKKSDVTNLIKSLASDKVNRNKRNTKRSCNKDDSHKGTKTNLSRETKDKSSRTKHKIISKSPNKKQEHKTKTYKKIKLVINVIYNEPNSQACHTNESTEEHKAGAGSNIELDFLNDFDIDEIVESLGTCEQDTSKWQKEMPLKGDEIYDGKTNLGLIDDQQTDAMDLIKILKGEEDDDLIRQSVHSRNDLLFSSNVHEMSQLGEHCNVVNNLVKPSISQIPDDKLEIPIKIKQENERLEMFTRTNQSISTPTLSNKQNYKKSKNSSCQNNSQTNLINEQDTPIFKVRDVDSINKNPWPITEHAETTGRSTKISYNFNTCLQPQNTLNTSLPTVNYKNTTEKIQNKPTIVKESKYESKSCLSSNKKPEPANIFNNKEEENFDKVNHISKQPILNSRLEEIENENKKTGKPFMKKTINVKEYLQNSKQMECNKNSDQNIRNTRSKQEGNMTNNSSSKCTETSIIKNKMTSEKFGGETKLLQEGKKSDESNNKIDNEVIQASTKLNKTENTRNIKTITVEHYRHTKVQEANKIDNKLIKKDVNVPDIKCNQSQKKDELLINYKDGSLFDSKKFEITDIKNNYFNFRDAIITPEEVADEGKRAYPVKLSRKSDEIEAKSISKKLDVKNVSNSLEIIEPEIDLQKSAENDDKARGGNNPLVEIEIKNIESNKTTNTQLITKGNEENCNNINNKVLDEIKSSKIQFPNENCSNKENDIKENDKCSNVNMLSKETTLNKNSNTDPKTLSSSCDSQSNIDEKVTQELEEKLYKFLGLPYSVKSLIHNGKFSTIFTCKRHGGKYYALKILSKQNRGMDANKEQMWHSLQNNIPRNNLFTVYLVNAFKCEEKWYILMEYYPKTLAQVLKDSEKSFCIEQIQDYARQLVTAVVFLRNNNMVHLDIKPGHILMNSSNTMLKLCGFDNLRYVNKITVLPNVGSASYRAPEVILGYPAGFEIDVWSTGVVLFEMAANKKLFPGVYNNDILYKQICTLGYVPYDMISKSRYAMYHFIGTKFMRRMGPAGKDINLVKSFPRNRILCDSIYNTYFHYWGHQRSKVQQISDMEKLGVLVTLLHKMLIIHPRHRLSIEFVYGNQFIYDAYKYHEW